MIGCFVCFPITRLAVSFKATNLLLNVNWINKMFNWIYTDYKKSGGKATCYSFAKKFKY